MRLVSDYFGGLSRHSRNQIINAIKNPNDVFWAQLGHPFLVLDAPGNPWQFMEHEPPEPGQVAEDLTERPAYLSLAQNQFVVARNQSHTLDTIGSPGDERHRSALFTNHMRFAGLNDEGDWDSGPSERIVLGPVTFFTIEHDAPSDWDSDEKIAFLDEQLSWFRKSENSDKSRPIWPLFEWARQFSDFRGMCACYSGNKSIHIHFAFDTSALMHRRPDLRDHVRPGLQECFHRLREAVFEIELASFKSDWALRLPEQYRRLPNGVVINDKDNHILGIPIGTRIPLISVWEKVLSKAPANATEAFVDELFIEQHAMKRSTGSKKPRGRVQSRIGDMESDEHDYCSEQFNQLVAKRLGDDDYPKGAGLYLETQWVGRLYADEHDQNPSTLILENNSRSFVQGGREPKRHVNLGLPLRFWIQRWRREWRARPGVPHVPTAPDDDQDVDVLSEPSEAIKLPPAEARKRLIDEMRAAIGTHPRVLIRAPEGIGKTYSMMELLPEIIEADINTEIDALDDDAPRFERDWIFNRPSLLGFASYDLVEEKCLEFNEMYSSSLYLGVVLKSFTHIYDEARKCVGEQRAISLSEAGQQGYPSLTTAIQNLQAKVWEKMKSLHTQMLKGVRHLRGRKQIVFFGVHDVLHQWGEGGLTPAFAHPDFFNTEAHERWKLAGANKLRVAVHDELTIDHIVRMDPAIDVEWCLRLCEAYPEEWKGRTYTLNKRYQTWVRFAGQEKGEVEFENALEIVRGDYQEGDKFGVGPLEKYGDWGGHEGKEFYAKTHQNSWYAQRRSWTSGVADHTILLTTEILPAEMFGADAEDHDDCLCVDLGELMTASGRMRVIRLPSCKSEDTEKISGDIRELLGRPDLHIITNKSSEIDEATTHASARGSNQFIGKDLGQIIHFKALEEYEKLQIVNAVYGFDLALRLSHVDQINQTAGRNLGYRQSDGEEPSHYLVTGDALWDVLWPVLREECRYGLVDHAGASKRRGRKSTRRRGVMIRAESGAREIDEIAAEHEGVQDRNSMPDTEIEQLVDQARPEPDIPEGY